MVQAASQYSASCVTTASSGTLIIKLSELVFDEHLFLAQVCDATADDQRTQLGS